MRRAQIIPRSTAGESNTAIAHAFGLAVQTMGHWRRRFHEHGLAGLSDAPRSGHPRTYDDERVAALLETVLAARPRAGTHWSIRTVAVETGISRSTVQRYFALFGVQPHRTKSFSLSTDPLFVDKVRDVVALYLNPPDNALVLCVDEKSQIQALGLAAGERTQPAVPPGLGQVEGATPGHIRHGTTTLFAALDVATGAVLAQCQRRHRPRSSCASWRASTQSCRPIWTCIARSTPTPRTSTQRFVRGWRRAPATTRTSRRPTRRGSTRWSAGSDTSRSG